MLTIYRHELKLNIKSLLVWTVCVGGMGVVCIWLFSGMQESMQGMAENFASMGAFADAFGMSRLSIATLEGYYAAEVGTIHALGGAMFAAVISTVMLSKEEDGHTGEFLFSLPIGREKAAGAKWMAVLTYILLFNLLCAGLYLVGIAAVEGGLPQEKFLLYHVMQFFMQAEIAAVCFAVSACMRKNRLGTGLGIVLFLYACDMIGRVVPRLDKIKALSPFSYANAADIFAGGRTDVLAVAIGAVILAAGAGTACIVYARRDLAA